MTGASEIDGSSPPGKAEASARVKFLVRQGKHRAALAEFDELTAGSQPSSNDGIWGHVAVCYRKLSMIEELRSLRERLAEARRPHVQVNLQLALAYAMMEKSDMAVTFLDSVCGDYPPEQQAEILRVRAGILSDAGRHDEAIKCVSSIFAIGTPAADRRARFALALAERKRDRAVLNRSSPAAKLKAYWNERRHAVYIHVCSQLIKIMGRSAQVVADIGSNQTPILDYYPGNPLKYSVDPGSPYVNDDVIAVPEDFFDWDPPNPVQLASCLQVMEHVPDVSAFAARLMELCEVALISVPYLEAPGLNEGHIHSRIDIERISDWFGRAPNYHFIAKELSGAERIICVFDTTTTAHWLTLCDHCVNGLGFKYRWSTSGSSLGN